MKKRAFTLVEIIVVVALLPLVLIMAYRLVSIVVSGMGGTSVDRLSRRSLLTQGSVIALEKLYNRVQEGIEILEPRPGTSADRLVFCDILNHRVTLAMHPDEPGRLVSMCEKSGDVPEFGPGCASYEKREDGTMGEPFYPAPPVRIDNVKSVVFTPMSSVCVKVSLILAEGSVETPLEVMMELKNHALAYQP